MNSCFQTTKWALKATKQENILLSLMSRSSKRFLLRETECCHTAPIICYDLKAASTATHDTNATGHYQTVATTVWPLVSPLLSQMLLLLLLSLKSPSLVSLLVMLVVLLLLLILNCSWWWGFCSWAASELLLLLGCCCNVSRVNQGGSSPPHLPCKPFWGSHLQGPPQLQNYDCFMS